jgi:hypothetical protein
MLILKIVSEIVSEIIKYDLIKLNPILTKIPIIKTLQRIQK